MSSDILIRADGVSVVRDGTALIEDITWEVRAGERWALLGPNGSGKTTLLRVVGSALWPTQGVVEILGERLGRVDMRVLRQRIATVSASISRSLRPELSALDVVLTGRYAVLETWWHEFSTDDRAERPADRRAHRGDPLPQDTHIDGAQALAQDLHDAPGGPQGRADHTQQGGLSRAVGAEQRPSFACTHFPGDVLDQRGPIAHHAYPVRPDEDVGAHTLKRGVAGTDENRWPSSGMCCHLFPCIRQTLAVIGRLLNSRGSDASGQQSHRRQPARDAMRGDAMTFP